MPKERYNKERWSSKGKYATSCWENQGSPLEMDAIGFGVLKSEWNSNTQKVKYAEE